MRRLKYFSPIDRYNDNHTQETYEDREWENVYRKRWQHDKVIRSTHGELYWFMQLEYICERWNCDLGRTELNYPTTGPDMPDFEPRGCPRERVFLGIS